MTLRKKFDHVNDTGERTLSSTHNIDGNITYREVDPEADFETAYQIFADTIKESVKELNDGKWPEEERKPFFKKGFSDEGMMMLFHNDKPIGVFCVTELNLPFVNEELLDLNKASAQKEFANRPTYKAVVLQRTYLTQNYQRQGIGSALMEIALERAHNKKLPLELEVLTTNSAGINAYGKHGYKPYAEIHSKGWNKKSLMRQEETEAYMPSPPQLAVNPNITIEIS